MITDALPGLNPNVILATFVLFCRIGACLMLAPGVSSSQIPMQIRLFIAVAITLSLAPLLLGRGQLQSLADDPISMLRMTVTEGLIGAMIGMLGRLFFSALDALAVATANLLGLVNPFGVAIDPNQATPPLATAITMAATALIFVADFHWEIIRGLVASYDAIPVLSEFDASYSLRHMGLVLGQSFGIAIPRDLAVLPLCRGREFRTDPGQPSDPADRHFLRGAAVRGLRRPLAALFRDQAADQRIHGGFRCVAHLGIAREETTRQTEPDRSVAATAA